jgi:hypothetical protein
MKNYKKAFQLAVIMFDKKDLLIQGSGEDGRVT